MYTIFILFTLSTMLISANLLVTVFATIVIIVFLPVSKKEEQMLLDRFGDEYRDYMKRTGRFFPRLRQHQRNAVDHERSERPSSF
jgi:protein-S-isoprenylcysteine O-methyltransferase Ste14